MTVVKLARWLAADGVAGGELTADDRAELDRIGPVRHIVAPNLGHHLYVGDAKAQLSRRDGLPVPPGLTDKRTDLTGDGTLSDSRAAAARRRVRARCWCKACPG
jgi:hypothetical protein